MDEKEKATRLDGSKSGNKSFANKDLFITGWDSGFGVPSENLMFCSMLCKTWMNIQPCKSVSVFIVYKHLHSGWRGYVTQLTWLAGSSLRSSFEAVDQLKRCRRYPWARKEGVLTPELRQVVQTEKLLKLYEMNKRFNSNDIPLDDVSMQAFCAKWITRFSKWHGV